MRFTDQQLVAMLRRSYTAVDGLWFMLCEEELGYERALALDHRVWQVMAKLQARKAREVLGIAGNSPAELARAFALKLAADGHEFQVSSDDRTVTITLTACSWRAALEKSGRLDIAADIGRQVCAAEGAGWAREFGDAFDFRLAECWCDQDECCRFEFSTREQTT